MPRILYRSLSTPAQVVMPCTEAQFALMFRPEARAALARGEEITVDLGAGLGSLAITQPDHAAPGVAA